MAEQPANAADARAEAATKAGNIMRRWFADKVLDIRDLEFRKAIGPLLVLDPMDVADEIVSTIAPVIAAAERERIRHAALDCADCGNIHEPHRAQVQCPCRRDHAGGSVSWASLKDGHAYAPAYVRSPSAGTFGDLMRQILDAAP